MAFLSHFVGVLVNKVDRAAWEACLQPVAGTRLRVLFSLRAIPLSKSGVGGLCWLIRPIP